MYSMYCILYVNIKILLDRNQWKFKIQKENDDVKKFKVLVLKIFLLIYLFRFLINRLDEYGDDYKDVQILVMWEVS